MSTGSKFAKFAGITLLCLGTVCFANADAAQRQRKAKKPALPPLPSGPTGRPVPQIPLDSIAPVPPEVNFQNGQLTIIAPNSTLADVLRAVRKQTGAEIDVPVATDRVVTHLGPGPTREVLAELLNGSRFNYVLLGSPSDLGALTRVVLVAKTGPAALSPTSPPAEAQQPMGTSAVISQQQPPEVAPDAGDADNPDDTSADDTSDQPADIDADQGQAPASPDQPAVKTPQQLLQEMQQRQLQMQQQQQPGQPPVPGPNPGVPRPPDQQ